ncbi:right-handed parallel beta-helix repeat-containing protein, partial [candidate division KSB1 bacterium]|nr:right-handed parallel beta-helix repeat-containing protein [candidate division KSB1 bacterium]
MKRYSSIIGFMLCISSIASAGDISFYVSPEGNDIWSGRFAEPRENDGPFATFHRAQQAVREAKSDSLPNKPVVVNFRGGVYNLEKKIFFLPEDSGSKEAPVTYRAYQDEAVLFSGGQRLTGWRQVRDNKWICDVPAARESGRTFQALFVNGERRYRASTPNEGFYRVKDPMEGKGWPFHHYRYQFGFYPGDILSNWTNLNDVQIVVLHFWSDARSPIESVDTKTLTVNLATPIWRRFTDDNTTVGARYFIDNLYEGMDEPGEWYLDRPQGKLYYLAFANEDVAAAEIIAPFFDQLLIFLGSPIKREYVEHIHLHGLNFAYTDWQLPPGDSGDHFAADMVPAAVEATAARHISITDCSFQHIGSYGIGIYDGCRNVLISRNVIRDLAAGGIQISGGSASEDSLLKTSHITITDNVLFDLGRIYYSGIGILLMHASESVIAHNHIRDLYYTGISVGKEWGYKPSAAYANRIEYNHVENAGQKLLSDMGGIYMLGISPGTVIRNNLVHGIYTHGYGGWGLYTDEGSSGIL